MTNPQFSVVLICRNEAKVIGRLLKSLEDFRSRGGEVVAVDTGSTDNTAQILRDWGAKVEEVGDRFRRTITKEEAEAVNARFIVEDEEPILKEGDGIFQFDQARNYAVSLATNDIVVWADADEQFTRLDIDAINSQIARGYGQYEYEFIFSHDQFGNPAIRFRQCKAYNRKMMEWRGRIHELVTPLVADVPRVYLSPDILLLEHYQNLETNRSGYSRGLALDCLEFPNNDRHSHYLARELMWSFRPKSALKEFERHVAMNGWAAERSQSMIFMGDIYNILSDGSKAIECYQHAHTIEPKRREAFMRLAWHFYSRGDVIQAATYAAGALEIPESDFYANQKGHYTNEPHEILYQAKVALGDREGAKYHFDKCLDYQPYNPKYQFEARNFYEYADPMLRGWMRPRELLFLYEIGKMYQTVTEIGSWCGKSTHALLEGGAVVTAVDHWKGSGEGDLTEAQAKNEDIYAEFTKNVGHFPNLKVLKMSSEEAASLVGDSDVVFIDGTHTYEGVKKDIELWRYHANYVLCGHDYDPVNWPGTVKAVDEMLGKPDKVVDSIWVKYL